MSIRISNRVAQIKPSATISVAQKARDLRAEGRDIISLGFGEPDFDTPAHIKEAAAVAIAAGETKYTPVPGTPALRQAIADKLQRENNLEYTADQIIVSNGAKQSMFNLLLAVLNEDEEVIVPAPYWVSYPDMVKMAGGQPVILNAGADTDFKISARQLASSVNENTRVLIINSPSNPTGKVYLSEEYQALGEVLRDHPKVLVACDDIYEHIYWGKDPFRTFLNDCPDLADRTVVINGMSKAFAMTGWRIGYAAGPADLVKTLAKVQSQSTSGACSISQAAATAALNGPQDCVRDMCRAFKERHDYLIAALNTLEGVDCLECEGAFYAFPSFEGLISRMEDIRDDVELAAWMIEHAGVAMVPGSAFGAPGHLRLSYATSLDNLEQCIARIERAIASI